MEHQITINGLRVSYTHRSPEKDPSNTRVILHGWGLYRHSFDAIAKQLSRNYPVISLDSPGFGYSQSPYFWGYEAYAKFVDQFLSALNLERVHLIGHSMGGGISIATAALFPKRVNSLILVNSAGIPMKNGFPSIPNRLHELSKQKFPASVLKPFLINSKNLFSLTRSVLVPVTHDLRALMPRVKAPCLLAWGDEDLMIPIENAYEMARLMPHSKVERISGGFHEWPMIWPERFCSLVFDF